MTGVRYNLRVPAFRPFAIMSAIAAMMVTIYAVAAPPHGYQGIFVLPLGYAFIMACVALATRGAPSLLLLGLTVVAFLRYVVLAALVTYNDGLVGRSWLPPADESVGLAIILMVYELATVMALSAYLEQRVRRTAHQVDLGSQRQLPLWAPVGLLVLSGALCLVTPQAMSLINFVRPTILLDEAAASPQATLFAMTLIVAKLFLCAGLIHRLYLYRGRYRRLMPWFALAITIANISIFFGTNRLGIMLTALVSIIFLLKYFGRRAAIPAVAAAASFWAIFNIVTYERQYYSEASTVTVELADEIQAYTGGVYNVAVGLEITEMYPEATGLDVLAYDFIRPTVGLNVVSRDWQIQYSNVYFNKRIFLHVDRRSQIMPMLAQSNLFFGPVFSPTLTLLFVFLGYWLLRISDTTKSPEMIFCIFLAVLRITFVFGQNSMNMMNYMSIYLIIPALLLLAVNAVIRLMAR